MNGILQQDPILSRLQAMKIDDSVPPSELEAIQAEMILDGNRLIDKTVGLLESSVENSLWWRKTAYIMATLVVVLTCAVVHLLMRS